MQKRGRRCENGDKQRWCDYDVRVWVRHAEDIRYATMTPEDKMARECAIEQGYINNIQQATGNTQQAADNRYIKYIALVKTTKGIYRLWDKERVDSIDLSSTGTNYVRSILTGSQFDDICNYAECTLTAPQMQKLVEHYVI